jgi:hypothetical protein
MAMRKILNIVLPLALIVGGVWWTWYVLTAGGEARILHVLMGLAPAIAGGLWLASDWLGL